MRELIKRPGKKKKPRRFKDRFDIKLKVQFDTILQPITRRVNRRNVVIAAREVGTSIQFTLISEVCWAMTVLSQVLLNENKKFYFAVSSFYFLKHFRDFVFFVVVFLHLKFEFRIQDAIAVSKAMHLFSTVRVHLKRKFIGIKANFSILAMFIAQIETSLDSVNTVQKMKAEIQYIPNEIGNPVF